MLKDIDEYENIGKVILIGINFLDKDEHLIEQYQTLGTFKGIDAESKNRN